jgi:hypothetical protein
MNRERAEIHLRLVAEEELRRAATPPRDSAGAPPDAEHEALAGRQRSAVAAALYDLRIREREVIALQYYGDLSEIETAQAVGTSRGAVRARTAHGMSALRAALQAGTSRVTQVAQLLTAAGALDGEAAAQVLADVALALGIRRTGAAGQRGPDPRSLLRSPGARLPLGMLTSPRPPVAPGPVATAATAGLPVPAKTPAAPGLAVTCGLNRGNGLPDQAGVTVSQTAVSPGEHLLNQLATRLLLLVLAFPHEIRLHPSVPVPEPFSCVADGLGDAVAALQACGALSPLSPVPGQLAALCATLNMSGHGIIAPPTPELPGPWLSVLAHYRHRRPGPDEGRDGCAALAVAFPELDGIGLTLLGLHNADGGTVLYGDALGMALAWPQRPVGAELDFPLRIWLRDSGGQWHATRAATDSGTTLRLEVVPPLTPAASWIEVLAAGPSVQARVTLPLRWH